jgi:hypothetical protein
VNRSTTLAELLRSNLLRSVYHEDQGVRAVKELARSYMTITQDPTRVMVRIKALYRSWAVLCAGQQVYASPHRADGGLSALAMLWFEGEYP